jgi:dynein heavy chain, axonemal
MEQKETITIEKQ